MGQFKHGQLLPSIEEVVCRMNPGEISAPVRIPGGFHVLKLEAKEEKEFAELKAVLESKLRAEAAKKTIDEMVSKVKVVKDKEYYPPVELKNAEPKKP